MRFLQNLSLSNLKKARRKLYSLYTIKYFLKTDQNEAGVLKIQAKSGNYFIYSCSV